MREYSVKYGKAELIAKILKEWIISQIMNYNKSLKYFNKFLNYWFGW